MVLFRSTRCAAFTWDLEDNFYGVFCDRAGNATRVRKHWRARRRGQQSPAQVLAAGREALGVDDNTLVIVGGDLTKACFVDLTMPRIAPEDMRGALQFELAKYSPINIDDLQWGFRILGKAPGDLNLVRLVYFRNDDWQHWLEAASGIVNGVDMVIPANAALDPMLNDVDVGFRENTNGDAFILRQMANGRQVTATTNASQVQNVFGIGPQPLADPQVNPGLLVDEPATDQEGYVPAIVLAGYGLTDAFSQDHRHWPTVPLGMRPRRNRFSKIYTVLVVGYLIVLAAYLSCTWLYDNHLRLQREVAARSALVTRIENLERAARPSAIAAPLREQLTANAEDFVPLPIIIAELSKHIEDRLWSKEFRYDRGELVLKLSADEDIQELTTPLPDIPVWKDYIEKRRQLPDETVLYQITAMARSAEEYRALAAARRAAAVPQPPPMAPMNTNLGALAPPPPPAVPGSVAAGGNVVVAAEAEIRDTFDRWWQAQLARNAVEIVKYVDSQTIAWLEEAISLALTVDRQALAKLSLVRQVNTLQLRHQYGRQALERLQVVDAMQLALERTEKTDATGEEPAVAKVAISGRRARVFIDTASGPASIHFVQEDGAWKVASWRTFAEVEQDLQTKLAASELEREAFLLGMVAAVSADFDIDVAILDGPLE